MFSRVWATVTISPKVKRRLSHLKKMGAGRPIPEANCAWAGVKSRGCGDRPATRIPSLALRMRPPRLSLTATDPPPTPSIQSLQSVARHSILRLQCFRDEFNDRHGRAHE